MTATAPGGRTVAFVLYPGLTPLDMVGPLQVIGGLATLTPGIRPVVVAERIEAMPSDVPFSLTPSHTFEQVPAPSAILVPGGGIGTIRAMANERILSYLRDVTETAEFVTSVCTGALVLAAAGLLEGRKATTHWAYHRLLDRLGAQYVPERWVEDGKFITAAGVSAGIDMGIHLAARLTNESLAQLAQLGIEYDPQPPFGGIDWGSVNRDVLGPVIDGMVRQTLPERPDLVAQLTGSAPPAGRGEGGHQE